MVARQRRLGVANEDLRDVFRIKRACNRDDDLRQFVRAREEERAEFRRA